jgi:predicted nucleotidyltransferase component of viral defense system
MRYATPAAFRAALEQRLANTARDTGTDLDRLRRRAVFERILARLAAAPDERWILKGGFALEVRLGDRARATRDLDVAMSDVGHDAGEVRDALIDALARDASDSFTFAVSSPTELAPDEAGRPGWRFTVTANLAGRVFQSVRVDAVARVEEIEGRTEHIGLRTFFGFADLDDIQVEVVDRRQHFAEKLHALTRDYGDRPNTRVKDLPDLLILIEGGLAPDRDLRAAVESLFAARATHAIPARLPPPPASWRAKYAELADELTLDQSDLAAAHARLQDFWATALADTEGPDTPHPDGDIR